VQEVDQAVKAEKGVAAKQKASDIYDIMILSDSEDEDAAPVNRASGSKTVTKREARDEARTVCRVSLMC
jgi:hypothetical protein